MPDAAHEVTVERGATGGPLRILLTAISMDSTTGGGVAERTRRLALHLSAQGHRCEVMTLTAGDLTEDLSRHGVKIKAPAPFRVLFEGPRIGPRALAARVRDADVVHITGYWSLLSIYVAVIARLVETPYVLCPAGELAALSALRPAPRAFHMLVGRGVLRRAALILAITPLERQYILDRLGVCDETVVVVPNGVEKPDVIPGGADLPPDPFVLFMGRLAAIKGPDLLLQAFARLASSHPDVRLVLAGADGALRSELHGLTATLGMENRVTFTGHLGEADRLAAYRSALFLAIPSRSEAMSLVALESGIVGTPVLLTDRCGFDDVARVGGGLVVPATIDGLESGLRSMLAAKDELPAWGKALRSHVAANYAWPQVVDHLVELLRGVTR